MKIIGKSTSCCHRKIEGIATIEFVMGFMAFWLMCMAWVEMSYMSYISAIGDLAIAEASRSSKVTDGQYLQAFQNAIHNSDSIWAAIADSQNFRVSIHYLAHIQDIAAQVEPCIPDENMVSAECGTPTNSAIAIYRIDYDFNSIFTYFLDETTVFSREVIVIQEYERDAFEL